MLTPLKLDQHINTWLCSYTLLVNHQVTGCLSVLVIHTCKLLSHVSATAVPYRYVVCLVVVKCLLSIVICISMNKVKDILSFFPLFSAIYGQLQQWKLRLNTGKGSNNEASTYKTSSINKSSCLKPKSLYQTLIFCSWLCRMSHRDKISLIWSCPELFLRSSQSEKSGLKGK